MISLRYIPDPRIQGTWKHSVKYTDHLGRQYELTKAKVDNQGKLIQIFPLLSVHETILSVPHAQSILTHEPCSVMDCEACDIKASLRRDYEKS